MYNIGTLTEPFYNISKNIEYLFVFKHISEW